MKAKPTILILGAKGLLGSELVDFFGNYKSYQTVGLSRAQADITDEKRLSSVFARYRPAVVINCAALINVEYCEAEPFEAWRVNTFGPGAVAHAARFLKCLPTIVHISSAYVFGNDKRRFGENDAAHPINSYGVAKLAGERLLEAEARAAGMRHFIVRTSWLYGRYRKTLADSIVEKLCAGEHFEVIDDQWSVVTSAKDLAAGVKELIEREKYASGIYHLFDSSHGGVTRYDIAKVVAETLGFNPKLLKRISRADIFKVAYPTSAVLVNKKFPALPDWKQSLAVYLHAEYGNKN